MTWLNVSVIQYAIVGFLLLVLLWPATALANANASKASNIVSHVVHHESNGSSNKKDNGSGDNKKHDSNSNSNSNNNDKPKSPDKKSMNNKDKKSNGHSNGNSNSGNHNNDVSHRSNSNSGSRSNSNSGASTAHTSKSTQSTAATKTVNSTGVNNTNTTKTNATLNRLDFRVQNAMHAKLMPNMTTAAHATKAPERVTFSSIAPQIVTNATAAPSPSIKKTPQPQQDQQQQQQQKRVEQFKAQRDALQRQQLAAFQQKTNAKYMACWNDPNCKPTIDQKFNALNLPNCHVTKDVGVCYDSLRKEVHQ